MPIKTLSDDQWKRSLSRLLILGPPNSGKTTSLLTWPRPIHVLSYPGEQGVTSLTHDPSNGIFVYRFDDPLTGGKRLTSSAIVAEIRQWAMDLILGKMGDVATFAGDGLHRFGDLIMDDVMNGDFLSGEPLTKEHLSLYPPGYRQFYKQIHLFMDSMIPNVVFTVWEGKERDTDESKTYHRWANLPGQLAKSSPGAFAATLYAKTIPGKKPGDPPQFVWQLSPDDTVWGVAVKVPPEIRAKLPRYCPQDHGALMKLLTGEGT